MGKEASYEENLSCVNLILLVMVVGCGKETEQKKNPYFQATVLEVKENSILVEPFEESKN